MNALAPVSDKIVPLVARLGSDSDGERLACLRQLDKVLGRAGMSWTDLARRLDANPARSCCAAPPRKRPETDGEIVSWLLWEADADKISDREAEFLCNLKNSFRFWRTDAPDMLRSPRQARWLRDIYRRLSHEAAYG